MFCYLLEVTSAENTDFVLFFLYYQNIEKLSGFEAMQQRTVWTVLCTRKNSRQMQHEQHACKMHMFALWNIMTRSFLKFLSIFRFVLDMNFRSSH